MEKINMKTGFNIVDDKGFDIDPMIEKKIGSILITLLKKASVLGVDYAKSAGRDNLSSMDIIYALQYYAHEFNNEPDLEDAFIQNETEYENFINDKDCGSDSGSEAGSDSGSDSDSESDSESESDSDESIEDFDNDDTFTRSESTDEIIQKMNLHHDNWENWNPTDKLDIIMKRSIDKILINLN